VIGATEFTAPAAFEPMGFPMASPADKAAQVESFEDLGDLPPPPVPSGI
jgi:hypothetical protein